MEERHIQSTGPLYNKILPGMLLSPELFINNDENMKILTEFLSDLREDKAGYKSLVEELSSGDDLDKVRFSEDLINEIIRFSEEGLKSSEILDIIHPISPEKITVRQDDPEPIRVDKNTRLNYIVQTINEDSELLRRFVDYHQRMTSQASSESEYDMQQ